MATAIIFVEGKKWGNLGKLQDPMTDCMGRVDGIWYILPIHEMFFLTWKRWHSVFSRYNDGFFFFLP